MYTPLNMHASQVRALMPRYKDELRLKDYLNEVVWPQIVAMAMDNKDGGTIVLVDSGWIDPVVRALRENDFLVYDKNVSHLKGRIGVQWGGGLGK